MGIIPIPRETHIQMLCLIFEPLPHKLVLFGIFRYAVTLIGQLIENLMDKTATERQQRYRKQISSGDKSRLQVILERDDAKKLEIICESECISKTDFVRLAINDWSKK